MTEFKSTLPPRKRAKTKEEKEQRRVERILRNRRAAHASREKKRKYVEHLESYVQTLTKNLRDFEKNQTLLVNKLVDSNISVPKLIDISHQDLPEFKFDNKTFIKNGKYDHDHDEDLEDLQDDDESTSETSDIKLKLDNDIDNSQQLDVEFDLGLDDHEVEKIEPKDDQLSIDHQKLLDPLSATSFKFSSDSSYSYNQNNNDNHNNNQNNNIDENLLYKDTFVNYLSPVSINTPSPINLSVYDPIEYNSEVVVLNFFFHY